MHTLLTTYPGRPRPTRRTPQPEYLTAWVMRFRFLADCLAAFAELDEGAHAQFTVRWCHCGGQLNLCLIMKQYQPKTNLIHLIKEHTSMKNHLLPS